MYSGLTNGLPTFSVWIYVHHQKTMKNKGLTLFLTDVIASDELHEHWENSASWWLHMYLRELFGFGLVEEEEDAPGIRKYKYWPDFVK